LRPKKSQRKKPLENLRRSKKQRKPLKTNKSLLRTTECKLYLWLDRLLKKRARRSLKKKHYLKSRLNRIELQN
jgi:hypothetical protein